MKQIVCSCIAAVISFSCGQGERQVPPQRQETIAQKTEPESASALIAEAKEKLAAGKAKLAQEGKYDCCMGDACNHCALAESSCTCAKDECYAGWQEGKGDVPNIRKENVKADFMEQEGKK
jgi:hypothetical protein